MYWLDWFIAVAALSAIVIASIWFKSPTPNTTDRFTAGRSLPWVFLGGSLAATTLSTDTPLLVTGAFYSDGLEGNWFWLATVPGFLATLFFFARYWRRSGAVTEFEILTLRYGDSTSIRAFRIMRAVLDGVVINILILVTQPL